MRVQCVICDTVIDLDDNLPEAKKLRNRPIHTFMCSDCNERITKKTEARLATGNFHFFRSSHPIDNDF